MSRVLCVWELGGNLGHLYRLLFLAEGLRDRQHEVIFAVRDVNAAAPILRERQFRFVAAPDILDRSRAPGRAPRNYSEMLEGIGFCDPARLTAASSAWRHLFSLLQPQALLLDHSPAGLLAARDAGVPRMLVGTGFSSPPRKFPMPDLRPWAPAPIEDLEAADLRVLKAINLACRKLGSSALGSLHDLFDVEQSFLCTFPELDHYRERESDTRYWGPISVRDGFTPPSWPASRDPRIFAYLRSSLEGFDEFLARLARAGAAVLAHVPGLSDDAVGRLESKGLSVAKQPAHLAEVRQTANLAVTYGGHGATATLLLGGVPVLMFPQHLEQYLLARRVAELGAGVIVERFDRTHDYSALALRMSTDAKLRRLARSFAIEHRDFEPEKVSREMIDVIEAYL